MYTVINALAAHLNAIDTAKLAQDGKDHFTGAHEAVVKSIMRTAPSGNGIDSGTILESHTDNRIVFQCSYHHMSDRGMYTHWTHHRIVVKASLAETFSITINGRDSNDVKEYLHEVFHAWLSSEHNREASAATLIGNVMQDPSFLAKWS